MFSVLLFSIISIPLNSNDKLIPEAFATDECTLTSLEELAHEFEHGRAYIQFHTDDGIHPQNTGPGDLASPGEIRGNIMTSSDTSVFTANITADQQILDDVDDPSLWDIVTASGDVVFDATHHDDHIDFTITMDDLDNVTGIHIHNGEPTENNHIHLVDILTAETSLITGVHHGPIEHMHGEYSGEISVDDLCPGAAHDHSGHSSASSSLSSSSSHGGGGARSAILAPNVILYNACSEELDGIMRIVTFNQQDRDLRVQLSFKDFTKWAIDVSDEVPYQKYIDVSTEKYEYSVFDARFPTDLEKVFVGLYDTKNKKRFIHHLVDLPSNSCMGSEVPFALKDLDGTLLKPFEPLEIPQPEVIESTPFELLNNYEVSKAQKTFNLITSHKPIFQKFEDPNSLQYIPTPWNESWNNQKYCFEEGERNRHHCSFAEKFVPQIAIAQEKFAEITWSEPVRQNFDEKKYYDKIYRGAIWLGDKYE